ncbi:hypothetical protein [Nocardia sp. NPDC051463]|uniref:hypothetical protein n=1 Tax=Nocardia sp. NPDC051463 TaxID=3154845 RepID=UPI00341D22B9
MPRIVHTVMDAVPAGSYLDLWDGTNDSSAYLELYENCAARGAVRYVARSRDALWAALRSPLRGFVAGTRTVVRQLKCNASGFILTAALSTASKTSTTGPRCSTQLRRSSPGR